MENYTSTRLQSSGSSVKRPAPARARSTISGIVPRLLAMLALYLPLLAGCGGPAAGGESAGEALGQQDVAALSTALTAAGYTMTERDHGGGRITHTGKIDDLQVKLEAEDGVIVSVEVRLMSTDQAKLADFLAAVKLALPGWTEAETWIGAQDKQRISRTTLADGTVVRLEPYPRGGLILQADYV